MKRKLLRYMPYGFLILAVIILIILFSGMHGSYLFFAPPQLTEAQEQWSFKFNSIAETEGIETNIGSYTVPDDKTLYISSWSVGNLYETQEGAEFLIRRGNNQTPLAWLSVLPRDMMVQNFTPPLQLEPGTTINFNIFATKNEARSFFVYGWLENKKKSNMPETKVWSFASYFENGSIMGGLKVPDGKKLYITEINSTGCVAGPSDQTIVMNKYKKDKIDDSNLLIERKQFDNDVGVTEKTSQTLAQSFVAPKDLSYLGVQIFAKKVDPQSDDLVLEIHEDLDKQPGNILGQTTVSANAATNEEEHFWVGGYFDNIDLKKGNRYWIVVYSGRENKHWIWAIDTAPLDAPDDLIITNDGWKSWKSTGWEACFRIRENVRVVDQFSGDSYTGEEVTIVNNMDSARQMFRAGLSGVMDRLDIKVAKVNENVNDDLNVELREVDNGQQGDLVFSQKVSPGKASVGVPAWVVIKGFSANVEVGKEYILVLKSNDPIGWQWSCQKDIFTLPSSISFKKGNPSGSSNIDYKFRTWVLPKESEPIAVLQSPSGSSSKILYFKPALELDEGEEISAQYFGRFGEYSGAWSKLMVYGYYE